MGRGWGFEEDDDPDERDGGFTVFVRDDDPGTRAGAEALTGKDADGVVTVTVDDAAGVVSVRLAEDWQEDDVRRGLGGKVAEAVNAATTLAVAHRASRLGRPDGDPAGTSAPAGRDRPADRSPITREGALELLHRVSADLAEFRQRLSEVADRTVSAVSRGGHVTVSGRRRQVADVAIDQHWLYGARVSEVEGELRDALCGFAAESSPGELSRGPDSGAIGDLLALVADPEATVRRLRQGSKG